MKVLFYIDCLGAGGKERRVVELMKGLKDQPEIDFEIVLMSKQIHFKELLDLKVNIHYLVRKSKKDVSIFRKLYVVCKKYRPDILHCWDSMTAVYAVPACILLGIKLVNGMITNAPESRNLRNERWLRGKLTFPFSTAIVGNSQAGLDAYSAPKHKSHVIYNGFNFSRIQNVTERHTLLEELNIKTRFVVGMVAAFTNRKDFKTYFEAATSLLDKRYDITFLAIGTDTDSEAATTLIKDKKEHFRLLGKKTNVESYINIFDIGVLTSYTEGISNSIMEYMALQKPVVASGGGGTKEIILNGKTGFLLEAGDVEGVSAAIEKILVNPNLQKEMGTLGRERVKAIFSLERMVEQYIHLYNKLC